MKLSELEAHVSIMLNQLRVPYKQISVIRNVTSQFVVEDFGVVVCCINRMDYKQVSDVVSEKFEGFRTLFITTNDTLSKAKDEVLWGLMRGGYLKWLRYNFKRNLINTLTGPDNLGHKIIKERLRIWADKPKYKFLIEDNIVALNNGVIRELNDDPGFFDYMPEEED